MTTCEVSFNEQGTVAFSDRSIQYTVTVELVAKTDKVFVSGCCYNGILMLGSNKEFKEVFIRSNIIHDIHDYLKRRMSQIEIATHPSWIIREVCKINKR